MALPLQKTLLGCLFAVTEAPILKPGDPSSVPHHYSWIGVVFTYLGLHNCHVQSFNHEHIYLSVHLVLYSLQLYFTLGGTIVI